MQDEKKFDPEWVTVTLNDAKEALESLMEEIEKNPDEAEEILDERIAEVYAKLNYAYNSAELGPEALLTYDDDELVSFPSILPFQQAKIDASDVN